MTTIKKMNVLFYIVGICTRKYAFILGKKNYEAGYPCGSHIASLKIGTDAMHGVMGRF